MTSTSTVAAPLLELRAVEEVVRRPRAVEDADGAVLAAPLERAQDDRAERREADPAGDDDDVAARRRVDRPRVAERPADAEHRARLGRADRAAVTAPTARTVRTTGPGRPGGPLTEIGTSPIPKA